ncbi:MAG: class I SAM-dependent methyltransferase [Tyzzerella sp.]|nr:class I SAM-dependent methyltransferase [Tyzzerella sp.]
MNVVTHYDKLIEENNDPFRAPPILQEYMNKWDGQVFIDAMCLLSNTAKILEIGVGTGRVAAKVGPYCSKFYGIDISPKTIERASENLSGLKNIELICADFSSYMFVEMFDIIYSTLTSMHFEDKQKFISKISALLKTTGRFMLSINKNQNEYINVGNRKLKNYPDDLNEITDCINSTDMVIEEQFETEFAHIFICTK